MVLDVSAGEDYSVPVFLLTRKPLRNSSGMYSEVWKRLRPLVESSNFPLLKRELSKGESRFKFSELSYQEYYAARYLARVLPTTTVRYP